MSGIKISQLTSTLTIGDSDIFLITQGDESKIVSGATLKAYIGAGGMTDEEKEDLNTKLNNKADGLLYSNGYLYLTSGGRIICDGVHITAESGGEETGETVLTLTDKSGGTNKTVNGGDACDISFNWMSSNKGQLTGNGTLTVLVGGEQKLQQAIKQGNVTVSIKDYLTLGENTVKIKITDSEGNNKEIDYTVVKTKNVVLYFCGSDGNSTILYTETITNIETPYDPVVKGYITAPAKASTVQYTYTYTGWDKDLSKTFSENTYIYPVFSKTLRSYTVRFYNGDTLLQTSTVDYGVCAVYNGDTSELTYYDTQASANDYEFTGWDYNLSNPITQDTAIHAKWKYAGPMTVAQVQSFAPKDTTKMVFFSKTAPTGDEWTTESLDTCTVYKKSLSEETSGNTTYTPVVVWFVSEYPIALESLENLFYEYKHLNTVDFDNIDASNVTSMEYMLGKTPALNDIYNLDKLNTENVVTMNYAFCECGTAGDVDISGFNTSKVTSMDSLFKGCRYIRSIQLRNFDTSNVKNMDNLFNGCVQLTSVDLSDFDTSNVESMNNLFNGCTQLTSIYLGKFNIKDGTSIDSFMSGVSNLTRISIRTVTPPTIPSAIFPKNTGMKIYIPKESLNTYKAAPYWSEYSDYFVGLSNMDTVD